MATRVAVHSAPALTFHRYPLTVPQVYGSEGQTQGEGDEEGDQEGDEEGGEATGKGK